MKKYYLILFIVFGFVLNSSYASEKITEINFNDGANYYESQAIAKGLNKEIIYAFHTWLEVSHFNYGCLSEDNCRQNIKYEMSFETYSADLNSDGVDEVFVYLKGPGICGSGGCTTYILQKKSEDKWMIIGEYFPNYGTSISSKKHEGFSIIYHKGKFGKYECFYQAWEKNLYSCYEKK